MPFAGSVVTPKGFAPLAIGLSLALIHLVSIPVTNTSVNPARSIGPALFAGSEAISELWLFILAPVVGALIAGFTYSHCSARVRPPASKRRARADQAHYSPGIDHPRVRRPGERALPARPFDLVGADRIG